MKQRLFGLLCLLVSGGLFAYNWMQLLDGKSFSLLLCAATPIFILVSLGVIIYPALLYAHLSPDRRLRRVMLALVITGGLLGLLNFYLMARFAEPPPKTLDKIPPMPGESARPQVNAANNNAKSR